MQEPKPCLWLHKVMKFINTRYYTTVGISVAYYTSVYFRAIKAI